MKSSLFYCVILILVYGSLPSLTKHVQSASEDLYTLIPGRYPDAISLPILLEELPDTPGGRAILDKLINSIVNRTGIPLPEKFVNATLHDSMVILNYTEIAVPAMSDVWTAANLAYWSGEIGDIASVFPLLASPFKFPDDIMTVPINMSDWIPTLEYVGDNLWWGFPFLTPTGVKQARINTVMALALNQLVSNLHLTPSDPKWFVIQYANQNYTRVDDFLLALMAVDSYEVSTYLEWHIAQFFGLYANDSAGNLLSVADPLMQDTGIWNKNKTLEIKLPAVHSQWMCTVNNSQLSFSVDWYQGDTAYAFYPSELYIISAWSGKNTSWHINGKQAVQAMNYMALAQDVSLQAAVHSDLFDAGYGVTGVCDDSCAIVELMLFGKTWMYPLLIQKQFVIPEVIARINQHDEDEVSYLKMLKAINQMTPDWAGMNPTTNERAQASIVWVAGEEPWECVVQAREILNELISEKS